MPCLERGEHENSAVSEQYGCVGWGEKAQHFYHKFRHDRLRLDEKDAPNFWKTRKNVLL